MFAKRSIKKSAVSTILEGLLNKIVESIDLKNKPTKFPLTHRTTFCDKETNGSQSIIKEIPKHCSEEVIRKYCSFMIYLCIPNHTALFKMYYHKIIH